MAKKTAEDWKKEGEGLKELLAAAKKKPQKFALVELKDGMCLQAHALHSLTKLITEAKKAEGAKKANCVTGSLKVSGKEIVFDCQEKELPGGMDTKFRKYLKKANHGGWKASFNVAIEDEKAATTNDAAAESDKKKARTARQVASAEPQQRPERVDVKGWDPVKKEALQSRAAPATDDAAVEEEKAQTTEEPELSKEQLTKDVKHITEIFKLSFPSMDDKQAGDVKTALKSIAGSIKSGDLVGAQNLMNKIGLATGVTPRSPLKAVSLGGGSADEEPVDGGDAQARKKTLTKDFAKLKPEIQRSLEIANPEHKKELRKLVGDFGAQMKSNDMEGSAKTFEEFRRRIADFDRKRSEGVAARKTRIAGIRKRAEAIAKRLEEISGARRAAQ